MSVSGAKKKQRRTESLYGDHTVTVVVRAVVPSDQLHPLDRDELRFIQNTHTFMINDMERLLREFKPEAPKAMAGMNTVDRARHMLEQTALTTFHASVPIKVLEDFEIKACASKKAVAAAAKRLLESRKAPKADEPSLG